MTYSTKMSVAMVAIGTFTFIYSFNCEADTGTFPPHHNCADIAGAGFNACSPRGTPDEIKTACAQGQAAIMAICTDVAD